MERATSLIISCLKFHQAVLTGTLEEDSQRGTPLCMSQYSMLFHACRIPEEGKDHVERHPGSRHIAVMCRGQVYWFNVYGADGRSCLHPVREKCDGLWDWDRELLLDVTQRFLEDAAVRRRRALLSACVHTVSNMYDVMGDVGYRVGGGQTPWGFCRTPSQPTSG